MASEVEEQNPWLVGLALTALAFLVLGSYGLVRSPIDARFLTDYGHESLPWVWVAVAATVFVVVAIYGRLADRTQLHILLVVCTLISSAVLAAIQVLAADAPASAFLLYVWKDVYVIVLLEVLWSTANAVMRVEIARWVYGLFCAAGSIGGFVGNHIASRLASAGEAERSLVLVHLVFVAIAIAGLAAPRWLGRIKRPPRKEGTPHGALQVMLSSRYLLLMLATVGSIQVATNLIEYVYSGIVEASFDSFNQRSHALANVNKIIDSLSLVLQLLTGVVLRYAGSAVVLLGTPILIASGLAVLMAIPGFAVAAAVKVGNKCLDYSLYRAAKELLYLPLGYEQKLKGKAVIDVFGYRVAKGGASVVLLAPIGLLGAAGAAIAVCALWFVAVYGLHRRYRRALASKERVG